MTVLVGGVGELWQGDLDLGRRAAERLAIELANRSDVIVEDLSYGAVAVAQRLEDLCPQTLVLVGATSRGRAPGAVDLTTIISPGHRRPDEVQAAVRDAVTGYVGTDLLVEVAAGLDALPSRTVVVDVEPAGTEPSTELSPHGWEALERALELVRAEVESPPVVSASHGRPPSGYRTGTTGGEWRVREG